jgi:dTDP-4-dehydrorhamnose 3,5-epimerase
MPESLPTKLDGVVLIEPQVFGDERGFFVETFSRDAWAALGVDVEFVQHNHSRSAQGTLRGIHFQTEPGQAKLVRCPRGSILDVAVDLRRGSPTYGQWESHVLDDISHHQLFVPIGFGHGFAVLSEVASPISSPASMTRRPRPGSPGMTRISASTGRSPSRC